MAKERMSEEQKNQLTHFIETASQLDEQSLLQLQFTANVLLAREKQIQLTAGKEILQCSVETA